MDMLSIEWITQVCGMKADQNIMTQLLPRLKQLAIVGLVLGTTFIRWNGEKCLIRGEELFEEKWMLKSVAVSEIIEVIFILATFRADDYRQITENTEGITIFFLLHSLCSILMKCYDIVPLEHKGFDLAPSLMPVILQLCSIICKGTRLQGNSIMATILLTFGASFITLGIAANFSINRIDYLSFSIVFLTAMKLLCLKHFKNQSLSFRASGNTIFGIFAATALGVPFLEFVGQSDLGTYILVSSISGLTSIGLLYLTYNHIMNSKTVLETSSYIMIGYLLQQIIQSEAMNIIFVLIGVIILIIYFLKKDKKQQEDTSIPFKDMSVSGHELFTRIEFMLFLGGVFATFLYVLPPKVSTRDMDNLSYVGLDKIVRKLLHKTHS